METFHSLAGCRRHKTLSFLPPLQELLTLPTEPRRPPANCPFPQITWNSGARGSAGSSSTFSVKATPRLRLKPSQFLERRQRKKKKIPAFEVKLLCGCGGSSRNCLNCGVSQSTAGCLITALPEHPAPREAAMDRFHAGARAALWMQLLVGICRGCCSWPRAQHGEAEARGIYCAEQLQPCWLQP